MFDIFVVWCLGSTVSSLKSIPAQDSLVEETAARNGDSFSDGLRSSETKAAGDFMSQGLMFQNSKFPALFQGFNRKYLGNPSFNGKNKMVSYGRFIDDSAQ